MRLAKKSILYFISDVGTSLIGFLATLYFALRLGPGPLGQYFLVIALLGWLTIPPSGIARAVNKRVSEGRGDHSVLSAGTLLNSAYGIVIATLAVLGGSYIEAYVGAQVGLLLAGLLVTKIFFVTASEGLKGQKRIGTAGFLKIADRILRVASQVAFIYLGYKVLGLVAGHTLALALMATVGVILYGYRPIIPSRDDLRRVLDYGKYSWLATMKSKTFGWMDTLVLGFFVTSGLIGVYEVSWRLASVLILVSNAIEHTLFPEISDIATEGNLPEVRNLLSESLFYAGLFTIPGFFGTVVLGPELLRIYGGEFVKGAPILLALIFARTINVYEMQLLNVINGIDRPDIAFRINLVFIVLNVSLNVALVYTYGWFGAAVATILSSLAMLVLSYRAVLQLIGRPALPIAGIGQQLLSAVIMAAAILVIGDALPVQNPYVTVGLVGGGAVLYGLVLYLLSSRIRAKVRSLALA